MAVLTAMAAAAEAVVGTAMVIPEDAQTERYTLL